MVTDLLDFHLYRVLHSTIIGSQRQCTNAYSQTRFQKEAKATGAALPNKPPPGYSGSVGGCVAVQVWTLSLLSERPR